MRNRKNVDMLTGSVIQKILIFAFPIFLGQVFQQAYNMVDSVVVGKYVGADALAAVGSTAVIARVLVGVMMGFPTGASVVAAQFLGAGQTGSLKKTITNTLMLLIGMGAVLTAIGIIFAEPLLYALKVPESIMADSLAYFRIYAAGLIFMALYNFYASFLRALGDSTTPLIFLIVSSVLNIFGDLFFVIVLHMGCAGVAIATALAQGVSVVLCYFYTAKTSEYFRFEKSDFTLETDILKTILRLGVPSSLQMSISGFGNIAVQRLINSYGTVAMAAYTAAHKMEAIVNLPMSAVATSLSLFVGQNIGAGDEERAKKGLHQSDLVCIAISVTLSLSIIFGGRYIMLMFVNAEAANVVEIGTAFMRTWAPLAFLHAIGQCYVSFLRGTGDSLHAMIDMFFDLIIRMITAYIFALTFNMGFMGIAWSIPCGWFCSTVYAIGRYKQGGWRAQAVVKRNKAAAK